MFRSLLTFLGVCLFSVAPAFPATVLVLQVRNNSQYADLNWIGESIAETLMTEFAAANQIVVDRSSRAEAIRRLSLRPDASFKGNGTAPGADRRSRLLMLRKLRCRCFRCQNGVKGEFDQNLGAIR